MSGHFICEYCGHEESHAAWCQELRPIAERWKGNLRDKETKNTYEPRGALPGSDTR